MGIGDSYAFEQ